MRLGKLLLLLTTVISMFIAGCADVQGTETKPATKPDTVMQKLVIYRAPLNGEEYLLKENWEIKDNGKTPVENALRILVTEQPKDTKAVNLFPEGTQVKSVKIEDGTAYVDFNKKLQKRGQGSYGELMITSSVANTLTEFPEIKRVQFLVEGEKIATISGHMDLLDPIERNSTLIKK